MTAATRDEPGRGGGGRPLGGDGGEEEVGPLQQGLNRLRLRFHALDSMLSKVAESQAPCSARNRPEIFWRILLIRVACSRVQWHLPN